MPGSAGEIMVNYGAMDAGAGSMRATVAQLSAEGERLYQAANAVKATWDAGSQQAFEARHAELQAACRNLDDVITGHAGALGEQTANTQSTDSSAAAMFHA